jgi:cob(I)alamin adenosyltransferase
MLLRICLIVAVIAGLAALGVSHVKVGGRITDLTSELDTTKATLETTKKDAADAKKDARQSKDTLKTVQEELGTTKKNLETASTKAKEQEQLALTKISELETVTKKFTDAERSLSRWIALGVEPNQVEDLQKEVRTVKAERDAITEEKSVLFRNNNKLLDELAHYKGTNAPVAMPGLKGKVVAVDPKWEFVVLDVGANQGARERGVLLVARNGKLIGKVQLSTIELDRSIANVLPEWKLSEIQEGDQVLF